MAEITAPNGVTYSDGTYTTMCQKEKTVCDFDGVVWLDDDSRVLATGYCANRHEITLPLYSA
jgi:hypothetical protein